MAVRLGEGVYAAQLTAKLAGISLRQLRYWVAKGLLQPTAYDAPRYKRDLFAFTDLVQAKLIGRLRKERVSLQKVAKAIRWLRQEMQSDDAWHTKTFATDGVDVFILLDPGETYSAAQHPGQRVFQAFLGEIADELERAGELLGLGKAIQVNRDIQGGTPVIRNTRIPTRLVSQLLADGFSPARIQRMYPGVTGAAIRAADRFEQEIAGV
jgi:uncharacterized protein (DUF433 family)